MKRRIYFNNDLKKALGTTFLSLSSAILLITVIQSRIHGDYFFFTDEDVWLFSCIGTISFISGCIMYSILDHNESKSTHIPFPHELGLPYRTQQQGTVRVEIMNDKYKQDTELQKQIGKARTEAKRKTTRRKPKHKPQ